MRQVLVTYVMRMRSVVAEWGAFPDQESSYVAGLIEKTNTMHRLLSSILGPADLTAVLDEVLRVYNVMLWESYRGLELRTKNQRKRLRNDVSRLTSELASFPDGVSSTFGTELQKQVFEKFPE
jgi:hypothetical protein